MQQFLETESDTIQIAVDHREAEEFDELLKKMGATVKRTVLPIGDFICSARLIIERKTRSDFEQSIIDGRLFSQLPDLVSNYERAVIIVEGTTAEGRINHNALLGAYASIIANYGASLIFTRNIHSTAELIFHFAKYEQITKKQPMRIYAKRRTLTPSQTTRSIIEMLPMVGPKLAKALLNHFGTIENLALASERDIAAVSGVGKKRAKLIKDIFSYAYVEDEDPSMY
ncbi:hypothetical protein KKB44_00825 [Candidatus Micrarchaeota archaeon]|nr:hypothetical protein [Candidatus Micrarchaeota archaeon]